MRTSDSIKSIAPALVKAQKAIETAHKTAANPFFKSKYADLPEVIGAVKGPLNDNGIAFMQGVDSVDGAAVITTRLVHETGEWIESMTPVYCKEPNNPQALGSGITYSKRYALQAICGLPVADADDDGNLAAAKPSKPSKALPVLTEAKAKTAAFVKRIASFGSPEAAVESASKSFQISDEIALLMQDIWSSTRDGAA